MGDTIDNIKGVPGIGEKGARELIATYGSLDNLLAHAVGGQAEAVSRGAARQHRTRRGRAASSRGSTPTCRSSSTPTALRYRGGSRERCFRSSTSSASARSSWSTRRPPTRSPRPTASSNTAGRAARAGRAAARGRPLRAARRCRTGRRPMRASIVGLAFSTAPRDGDYVPIGHRALGDDRQPAARRRRSTRCEPSSKTPRSGRSATT